MKFEIDVSELIPGDTIAQSECEAVLEMKRDADRYEYQFRLMQLAEHVENQLKREGKVYTITTENGAINVLTHEQASKYNAARFESAISKMRRCHRRLVAVDMGRLDAESKDLHLKSIARQANVLQIIGRRKADVTPVETRTVKIKRG